MMDSELSTGTKQNESTTTQVTVPFKVYFPTKEQIGKSMLKFKVDIVAPKFYSRTYRDFVCSEADLKASAKKLEPVGPSEKYARHITENQRYGWYKKSFNRHTKYLNFTKCTHEVVKEHLMTYAKIRD